LAEIRHTHISAEARWKVIYSSKAENDLDETYHYIAGVLLVDKGLCHCEQVKGFVIASAKSVNEA
jgi:hypothetical protein